MSSQRYVVKNKITRSFTDDRWIKCPSRTFPNKHYYFNPYTGSAVWDLNDSRLPHQSDNLMRPCSQCESYPTVNNYFPPFPYTNGISYENAFPMAPFWISQPVCVMPVAVPVNLKEETDFVVHTTSVPLSSRFKNLGSLKNNESDVNKSINNEEVSEITRNHSKQQIIDFGSKTDKKRKFSDEVVAHSNKSEQVQVYIQPKLPRKMASEPVKNCGQINGNIYDYDTRSDDISSLNVTCLKRRIEPNMRQDMWYIVADTDILLYKLVFIEKLVKSDPTCRLLLPYCVLCEVNSISSLSHRQVRVRLARKVSRFLNKELPTKKTVIGQTAQQASEKSSPRCLLDEIIQCCKQLLDQHFLVVLVSNNEKLRKMASLAKIQSYSTSELLNCVKKQHLFLPCQKLAQSNEDLKLNSMKCTNLSINQANYIPSPGPDHNSNVVERDRLQRNIDDKYENRLKIQNEKACHMVRAKDKRMDKNLKIDIKSKNFDSDNFNSVVKRDTDENHYTLEELTFDLSFSSMVEKYDVRYAKGKTLGIEDWNPQSTIIKDETEESKNNIECVKTEDRYKKNVDDINKKTTVRRKLIRDRKGARMHKWAIRLCNIMTDALLEALKEKHKKLGLPPPNPKNLHGLAQAVKVYFRKDEEVRKRANELTGHLLHCTDEGGSINYDLELKQFMKLFSHSHSLLLSLKSSKDIQKKEELDVAINQLKNILLYIKNPEYDTTISEVKDAKVSSVVERANDFSGKNSNVSNVENPKSSASERTMVTKTQNQVQSTVVRTNGDSIKLITLTKDRKMLINCRDQKADKKEVFQNITNDSQSLKVTDDEKIIGTINKTCEEDDESSKTSKNIAIFNNVEESKGSATVKDSSDKTLNNKVNDNRNVDTKEVIDLDRLDYSPMSFDITEDEVFKDENYHDNENHSNRFEEVKSYDTALAGDLEGNNMKEADCLISDKAMVNAIDESLANGKNVVSTSDSIEIDDESIPKTEQRIQQISQQSDLRNVAENFNNSNEIDNTGNNIGTENVTIMKTDDSFPSAAFEIEEHFDEKMKYSTIVDKFEELCEHISPSNLEKEPMGIMRNMKCSSESNIESINEVELNTVMTQSEDNFTAQANVINLRPFETEINVKILETSNETKKSNCATETKELLTTEKKMEAHSIHFSKESEHEIQSLDNKNSVYTPTFLKYDNTFADNEILVNNGMLNINRGDSLTSKKATKSNSVTDNSVVDAVLELEDNFLATIDMQEFDLRNNVSDLLNYLKETDEVNQRDDIKNKDNHLHVFEIENSGGDKLTNDDNNKFAESISFKGISILDDNTRANRMDIIDSPSTGNEDTSVVKESRSEKEMECEYFDTDAEENLNQMKGDVAKEVANQNNDINLQLDQTENGVEMMDTCDFLDKSESDPMNSRNVKEFCLEDEMENTFLLNSEMRANDFEDDTKFENIVNYSFEACKNETVPVSEESVQTAIDEFLLEVENVFGFHENYQSNNEFSICYDRNNIFTEHNLKKDYLKKECDSKKIEGFDTLNLFKLVNNESLVNHSGINKDHIIKSFFVNNAEREGHSVIETETFKESDVGKCVSSKIELEYEGIVINHGLKNNRDKFNAHKVTIDAIGSKDADVNKEDSNIQKVKNFVDNTFDDKKKHDIDEIENRKINVVKEAKSDIEAVRVRKYDAEECIVIDNLKNEAIVDINKDKCDNSIEDFSKVLNETFTMMKKYIDSRKIKSCDIDGNQHLIVENRMSNVMKVLCMKKSESFETENSSGLSSNDANVTENSDSRNVYFTQCSDTITECLNRAKVLQEKLTTLSYTQ